jgi:CP family cyanate transporter-like MFS transporter
VPGALTAAGIVLIAFNLRIAIAEIPPVLPDLGIGDTGRSLLVTIPVICFSLAAFAGPPLGARLGEERGLLVLLIALIAGIVLRPLWPTWSLFAGTIVCGLAIAVMNVLMPSVVRRRFPQRVGEMLAAYTMAISISSGLTAALTIPILRATHSLGLALGLWAAPAAIALVAWLPQLRWPRPERRAIGLAIGLLKDSTAWQITFYFGLQSMVFYALLSWLPTIFRDHGVSPANAGALLGVMNAIGITGNFAAPMLASRLRDQRLVVLASSGLTLAGLGGLLFAPGSLAFLWAVLLGVGTSGSFSMALLLMASKTTDPALASRLSSMAQGLGYVVAAGGPFIAGLLHSATGGWEVPLLMTIGVSGLQLAAGLRASGSGAVVR